MVNAQFSEQIAARCVGRLIIIEQRGRPVKDQFTRKIGPASSSSRRPVWALLLGGLIVLSACSGGRETADVGRALSRAATAVEVAKSTGTKRYAASELAAAEEKLLQAQYAARTKDFEEAERLISECLVNIHLATTKAEAARLREQAENVNVPPSTRPTEKSQ